MKINTNWEPVIFICFWKKNTNASKDLQDLKPNRSWQHVHWQTSWTRKEKLSRTGAPSGQRAHRNKTYPGDGESSENSKIGSDFQPAEVTPGERSDWAYTGHFIRYASLVPGQNCLNSSRCQKTPFELPKLPPTSCCVSGWVAVWVDQQNRCT